MPFSAKAEPIFSQVLINAVTGKVGPGTQSVIEEQTTTWDKTVIDRQDDLKGWVVVLRRLVEDKRIRKIFAFANNHYAGHAPATVKLFWQLWNQQN